MATQIIDGKAVAARIRAGLATRVAELVERGFRPGLAVVLVGDDPASHVYVRNKTTACAAIGVRTFDHRLPAQVAEPELLALIERLNQDPEVDGILVQMPLPPGLDGRRALLTIDPEKDVDGLHPDNLGRLVMGQPRFVACTPLGIMRLLAEVDTPLVGADAVVIGRSNMVGKPIAALVDPGRRDHHALSLADARSGRTGGARRRGDRRRGSTGDDPGRLDQAWRHRDRRRYQPWHRRQAHRRRGIRRRRSPRPCHHPRPGRRRVR